MQVKELIEILKNYDQEADVHLPMVMATIGVLLWLRRLVKCLMALWSTATTTKWTSS